MPAHGICAEAQNVGACQLRELNIVRMGPWSAKNISVWIA
jgi:hypothetical protein